jgi:hypothetical protein
MLHERRDVRVLHYDSRKIYVQRIVASTLYNAPPP